MYVGRYLSKSHVGKCVKTSVRQSAKCSKAATAILILVASHKEGRIGIDCGIGPCSECAGRMERDASYAMRP